MKVHALLISIFMALTAVVYTMVTHTCLIQPYNIQPWTGEWVLFSIPAFVLVLYSIGLVIYGTIPQLFQKSEDERAETRLNSINLDK